MFMASCYKAATELEQSAREAVADTQPAPESIEELRPAPCSDQDGDGICDGDDSPQELADMVTGERKLARRASRGTSRGTSRSETPPSPRKSKPEKKKKVTTWKRSQTTPNTARLMIGDQEELPIKGSQINVQIDGFRARVLMDLFFFNDRHQQYEGTFKLRLPNEASPYFLAFGESVLEEENTNQKPRFDRPEQVQNKGFDPERIMTDRANTWKAPKEARMVPKEKAAYAYRETVHRRVDPALMEWSGAGIFSARIFPIFPRKLHRVVIGYDVDLQRLGQDLEYRFDLPGNVPNIVADIHVTRIPGVPIVVTPETEGTEDKDQLHFRYDVPLERELKVRLNGAGTMLLTGADSKTGSYFATRFKPKLPASQASGASAAVFMVDVSLSSNPDRFNAWLALLKALLQQNHDELKRFAVMFFNIETFWWKEEFVRNTPENIAAMMAFANTLALEGATDMDAALKQASNPGWVRGAGHPETWDLFLLSDGAGTWGESEMHALSRSLKSGRAGSLFAYRTGLAGTDTRILAHLARESRGAVFSVAGESEVVQAATAHRNRPWKLAGVELAGGTDLFLAGNPVSLFPGQPLLLVGKGTPKPGAEVVLKLRQNEQIKEIHTSLPKSLESTLTPRIYGQVAVGRLEELKEAAQDESEAYSRHFRITGRTCSLLMLETEADYQRFNIKPEKDASFVKNTRASDIVARITKEMGDRLGKAKTMFMNWLGKMKNIPGASFKVSPTFQQALDKMPEKSFIVQAAPVASELRTWKGIPGLIQDQMVSGRVEYDPFILEAKRRREKYGPGDALKVFSSLVENQPGDTVLARDVGFSAMEMGFGGHAYHLFRRVASSRPYEPQTYRAMAHCLAEMKMADLALAYYEVGLSGRWDNRFGEFRKILQIDYLRFLRRIEKGELSTSVPDFARTRMENIKVFDADRADLLITITWNTDATDIDLHIIEPTGEECFYSHPKTRIGGMLTRDVTQGFGPEMYLLRKAAPGEYKVRVKYFAGNRNRASTRTKVYVTIFRNWGSSDENVTRRTATLEIGKSMHDLATVRYK
ncbi:MAG: DUF2135 domain-containing protein, partial [Desulfobacteraceae bacterium]|nr:DUF2135 domain-containing protein [Desulfobacteraceae bacterium]